jgi:hypothetical protein
LPRLIRRRLTHGVIGNTSDFGSEESGFEPLWVNKKQPEGCFLLLYDQHQLDTETKAGNARLIKIGKTLDQVDPEYSQDIG